MCQEDSRINAYFRVGLYSSNLDDNQIIQNASRPPGESSEEVGGLPDFGPRCSIPPVTSTAATLTTEGGCQEALEHTETISFKGTR